MHSLVYYLIGFKKLLGAMGRRIDSAWYNTGRSMCYPVCGMVHIK